MFTFVFQPRANRESLKEFNLRVQEFCAENPVVSIDATAFGPNLILQGATADDMDTEDVPTLTATTRTLSAEDADLEEQLDGLIAQETAKHHAAGEDGDPNLPVRFIIVQGEKRAWVVLLCINGIAEDGENGGGEGGGDEEPAPVGPPPAAGFQEA